MPISTPTLRNRTRRRPAPDHIAHQVATGSLAKARRVAHLRTLAREIATRLLDVGRGSDSFRVPLGRALRKESSGEKCGLALLGTVVSMAAGCALFEVPDPTPAIPPVPDRPVVEDVGEIPSLEREERSARRDEVRPPSRPAAADPGQLILGQWRQGWLHCDEKKCNDSYSVEVPQSGELQLDLRAPGGKGLPDLGVIIEDLAGRLVGASVRPLERPRIIRKKVEQGSYQVEIYALGGDGEMVSYDLVAKLEPKKPKKKRRSRPKPKKPRPQFRVVRSEILEIEREGGEPTFVLIEAGQDQKIAPGLGGQLVENGKRIAEIEVVEVFPDGSRVRIVDRLSAPITIQTTAEILVPESR